jgi:hypothetical protein
MSNNKKDKLMETVKNTQIPMSPYQIENFVVRGQITTVRQVRQLFLELKSREEGRINSKFNMRRASEEIKILEREISETDSGPELEILKIDLEEKQEQYKNIGFGIKQSSKEIDTLLDMLEKASDIVDLNKLNELVDKNEEEYWIKRLSKQAALDMATTGVISVGNMDAILSMSDKDQIKTLASSIEFSNRLRSGIQNIERKVLRSGPPEVDLLGEGTDESKTDVLSYNPSDGTTEKIVTTEKINPEVSELLWRIEFDNEILSDSVKKLK